HWIVEKANDRFSSVLAFRRSSGKTRAGWAVITDEKWTSTAFRLRRNMRGEKAAILPRLRLPPFTPFEHFLPPQTSGKKWIPSGKSIHSACDLLGVSFIVDISQ